MEAYCEGFNEGYSMGVEIGSEKIMPSIYDEDNQYNYGYCDGWNKAVEEKY